MSKCKKCETQLTEVEISCFNGKCAKCAAKAYKFVMRLKNEQVKTLCALLRKNNIKIPGDIEDSL